MRRLTLVALVVVVAALAASPVAGAHNIGWPIHKALCKVGIGCRDVPPRPGPQTKCDADRLGAIETIWDERLGAYVEWVCTENGWRRVRIVPAQGIPWDPPERRRVIDYHRACKAIVCLKIAVGHHYPSQWILGRSSWLLGSP